MCTGTTPFVLFFVCAPVSIEWCFFVLVVVPMLCPWFVICVCTGYTLRYYLFDVGTTQTQPCTIVRPSAYHIGSAVQCMRVVCAPCIVRGPVLSAYRIIMVTPRDVNALLTVA